LVLKVAWSPQYNHPLPQNHRFPMEKYDLLPRLLIQEGIINPDDLFDPDFIDHSIITLTHSDGYLHQLLELTLSKKMIRESGFPLSKSLIDREIKILSGTVQCTEFAFNDGVSLNIAGGTHHAFKDRPEGFCLLNDQAVAAHYLLENEKVERILIIDLDVHQGNGTASIFQSEPRVFTFSMHGERNYPFRKQVSDLDVSFDDGIKDEQYLEVLSEKLEMLKSFNPDFIFYQAGTDVLDSDKLGRLSLTLDGCAKRDEIVFDFARQQNTPIVVCMGGGYSEDVSLIVEAHANTFKKALKKLIR